MIHTVVNFKINSILIVVRFLCCSVWLTLKGCVQPLQCPSYKALTDVSRQSEKTFVGCYKCDIGGSYLSHAALITKQAYY